MSLHYNGLFCVLMIVQPVVADTTIRLMIAAEVQPSACQLLLDNSGVVNFGQYALERLNSDAPSLLGSRDINLHIQCESPRQVAWSIIDERADTLDHSLSFSGVISDSGQRIVAADSLYGLGLSRTGRPLGAYRVEARFAHAQVDGQHVSWSWITAQKAGQHWQGTGGDMFTQPGRQWFTPTHHNQPLAFSRATVPLRVMAIIAPGQMLASGDITWLAGKATITLTYL
ncbi:DUF1120 domain-containing protein [Erwiniaceae bacterium BAC15a-03b]|uniref:DUF1120 domain-containing protein n=1 Tax=Winslowiella arboricola TaxID=2978220 RepID=A0A9J6PXX2_9GAMM|nr:DUF1120 domain-containing protein [Winslowiella arboricola]MCU5772975.1 DUF1120 domain-containing protein [Winslowiella arboricola]MCU5780597.1 DUF1120 domain-containing protein [Winslowiella arboricola]